MTELAGGLAGDDVATILQQASVRWAADGSASTEASGDSKAGSLMLDALATVLHDSHDIYYVSTPITTGPQFVDWWRTKGHGLGTDHPDYAAELDQVIEHNIAAVRPLVAEVERRFGRPVIDPTRLGPLAGWRQHDYHRFWVEVIERFVATMVFADGWHYSSGCSLEFAAAIDAGLTTLDSSLQPLRTAAAQLASAGLADEPQQQALAALRRAGLDG